MEFTSNWFGGNIENWKAHLLPLKHRPLRCLEIGSYEGRSALWMVENVLLHSDSQITCVDPHEYEILDGHEKSASHFDSRTINAARQRFLQNTSTSRSQQKLVHIAEPSARALLNLPAGFDFIYIDGSHYGSDVMTDAVLSWLLLRNGGLLAFDDYRWQPPAHAPRPTIAKPQPAIDSWLSLWEGQFERLPSNDSQVWVKRTCANPLIEE